MSKQEVLNFISGLPDDVSFDEVLYKLYMMREINAGLDDVACGSTRPHTDVKRLFAQMACSIVWTDRAVANLKSIEAYIAEDSPKQAKKVVNEIIDYVENLQVFPFMGSVVHELPEHDLRQLVKYSYRIIYSAEEDAVNVVTIIHGKQDFLQRFLRDSFSDVTP